MDRNSITRQSFKRNYLKAIIIRMDFQGVFLPEIESIFPELKNYLSEKSFDRYEEKTSNEMEFSISEDMPNPSPIISKRETYPVYCFFNDDIGISVMISSKFFAMSISTSNYIPFEEYESIFLSICETINNHIKFLTPTRLGIRKINYCFSESIELISRYFKPEYYSYSKSFDAGSILYNGKRTMMSEGHYTVNVLSDIRQGISNDTPTYKITLDTDVFTTSSEDIKNLIFQEKSLSSMNDKLFKIYVDSMEDCLIEELMGDEKLPVLLQGVELND